MSAKSINHSETVSVFAAFGLEAVNEELTSRKMSAVETPEAGATLLAMGVRSLDEFAATALNLSRGTITSDQMTAIMARAFPSHRIGERHGPHYVSLARTGSLSPKCLVEVRYVPGRASSRRAAPKAAQTYDLSSVDEKQLNAMVKSTKGTPLEAVVAAEVARRAPKAE